ncbi:MAG: starch-binding protein [Ruminococcaceae bacterium]|nr:starch-binding protein [Oscillospiraceae bacterium]
MKKSLSKKLNIFKTSPLIGAIAILEVVILICVSTFAWFVFADNTQVSTDVISVEPDSGLEIDFSNAAENDYVNIWNYLEEFTFEPVTSLDGRNIFIPTTGTFNAVDTSKIVFREGTVNDMNSKYINIDFTLTNTGDEDMPVYLSSKSYFKFNDSANGKALRLAFYQNDGSSGDITSSLLSKEYDGDVPEDGGDGGSSGDTFTVYLDAPSSWTDKNAIKAYTWGDGEQNGSFPGKVMTYDSASGLYSYTYSSACNKIIFSYNGNQNQTVDLDVYDGGTYKLADDGRTGTWALNDITITGGTIVDGGSNDGDTDDEGKTTVYFYNSLGWKHPYAYIWTQSSDKALSSWPGKPMTQISGDIYYYTFSSKYDSIIFNDGNDQGGAVKTSDIYPAQDGHIYMIGNPISDNEFGFDFEDYVGSVDGGTYPVISPGVSTGFQRPYAPVIGINNSTGSASNVIPAFASSIDDYNYGSKKLFTIKAKQTLPLSMIVWLEGTDPDCTGETYAGKDIDMNLVFATDESSEDMYTYKFLDKTKENWIDDTIVTDTGVSFKPVIQLYDVDNHKGYQMSVSNDSNGKPTIWTCKAPEDLRLSKHIMFRRVNPMNEDEVWNYWDTYGFNNVSGAVVDSTVYFSAFSDGAPTNALKDGDEEPNAPERSCGGLWGDHETQIITVYDGTEGQWIKNSDKSNTESVLTMNYTYNGQTVEYKASGSGRDMYYFVVPMDVYSKSNPSRPAITFKRYFNFNNKYALNSDLNELTYHMSWTIGVCEGKFAQISGNQSADCYWGSDIIYVQAKEIVKSKMDNAYMQVHFYTNSSGSETSGTSTYKPLYKNNNYKSDVDNGYGYVCVIPSDKRYYFYRVERCDPNDHANKWNITPLQDIDYESTTNTLHSNTVGKNICSIENLYLNIYLEVPNNMSNKDWCPEYYIWKDSTGANEKAWPGNSMKFVQAESASGNSTVNLFKCYVDISRYDYILFSNEYDGQNRNYGGNNRLGTDSDYNGMVFRAGGSYPNSLTIALQTDGRIGPGEIRNETLNAVLYEAENWEKNGS